MTEQDQGATTRDYSETLFLPKTDFPMRAGLPAREPEWLRRWEEMDIYRLQREQAKGREKFILHDGPPYANGNIHIGHALNKILKDLVSRSMQMLGHDSPYVPGWDCHGLPIEWKIEEQYRAKGRNKDEVPINEFRKECREFALQWIDVQREEFKRLGINGEWDNPYTTMAFDAEATIAGELMKFSMSGQLYRGSKPVMWSVVERTALAEAEIEYHEVESDAIWVKFPVAGYGTIDTPAAAAETMEKLREKLRDTSVVIWTTTPWTIPGNRAISFSSRIAYGLYEVATAENDFGPQPGEKLIFADALAQASSEKAKLKFNRLGDVTAAELEGISCAHPLAALGYDFDVPLLDGEHVTEDTGTGFVHTAPGHGADDFDIWTEQARHKGVDPAIPFTVDDAGFYTRDVPGFGPDAPEGAARVIDDKGKKGDANQRVIAALIGANALFARGRLKHQYPHSWRSKKPIIFRNTPQWFVYMDKELGGLSFDPSSGAARHLLPQGEKERAAIPASSSPSMGKGSSQAANNPLSGPSDHLLPQGEKERAANPDSSSPPMGEGSSQAANNPSSGPSGHLLPQGEKERAENPASSSPSRGEGGRDTLRARALAAIDDTRFVPAAGQNRLRAMIAERPDWVLSRQRAWGVPIAVFVGKETGEILKDEAVNARIVEAFAKEGADAWFADGDAARFLGNDYNPDDFEQVRDILDVWFDSGSTHEFVLRNRKQWPDLDWPATMYLEGSDQHRGWFHSSLLESCGTNGRAPYNEVLTHGFTMDKDGMKMSKSTGNTVAPQDIIKQYGADILRLWAASIDYSEDHRIGDEILKNVVESYRKMRNSLRWMLGNLAHYEGEEIAHADMPELERLVLHRLKELDVHVQEAYRAYDYKRVVSLLSNFMNIELSAFYFDVRKDALYCDPISSVKRMSALYVLNWLYDCLTAWLAPILVFTMEEVWLERHPGADSSVHLRTFPELPGNWQDRELAAKWQKIRAVRRVVTGALEIERREKSIGSSLEAAPVVHVADTGLFVAMHGQDMAEICITSGIEIMQGEGPSEAFRLDEVPGVSVIFKRAEGTRCARSWKVLSEVGSDADYPDLSLRDAEAMRERAAAGIDG